MYLIRFFRLGEGAYAYERLTRDLWHHLSGSGQIPDDSYRCEDADFVCCVTLEKDTGTEMDTGTGTELDPDAGADTALDSESDMPTDTGDELEPCPTELGIASCTSAETCNGLENEIDNSYSCEGEDMVCCIGTPPCPEGDNVDCVSETVCNALDGSELTDYECVNDSMVCCETPAE